MRITKEQIELMNRMKLEGKIQVEIASQLKITQGKVSYYLGNGTRQRRIESSRKRYRNLSIEQKRKYWESRREYNRIYMRNKYKNDLDFREKHKERMKKYKQMKGGNKLK